MFPMDFSGRMNKCKQKDVVITWKKVLSTIWRTDYVVIPCCCKVINKLQSTIKPQAHYGVSLLTNLNLTNSEIRVRISNYIHIEGNFYYRVEWDFFERQTSSIWDHSHYCAVIATLTLGWQPMSPDIQVCCSLLTEMIKRIHHQIDLQLFLYPHRTSI